jgi:ribosomal protein S18 acetylase RimI-like enzyme
MKLTLRKAIVNDLEGIKTLQALLNSARKKQYAPSNQAFHSKIEANKPIESKDLNIDTFFLVEDDGMIAGYIWGSIDERPGYALKKMGYIDELFVKEKYRGRGIAKKLLNELEKFFIENGCEFIMTRTDFENKDAQGLYSSVGMNAVTVEFWKEL